MNLRLLELNDRYLPRTPAISRDYFKLTHYLIFTGSDTQIADLVEFNGLHLWIGDRQCITGYSVTDLKLVFGVSGC